MDWCLVSNPILKLKYFALYYSVNPLEHHTVARQENVQCSIPSPSSHNSPCQDRQSLTEGVFSATMSCVSLQMRDCSLLTESVHTQRLHNESTCLSLHKEQDPLCLGGWRVSMNLGGCLCICVCVIVCLCVCVYVFLSRQVYP